MIYFIAFLFLLVNVTEYLLFAFVCQFDVLCYSFTWGFFLVIAELILGTLIVGLNLIAVVTRWQFKYVTKLAFIITIIIFFITFVLFNDPFLLVDRLRMRIISTKEQIEQQRINTQYLKDKPGEVRFTGAIQSFNTSCVADGDCNVTIDDKSVIIYHGGLTPQGSADSLTPKGSLIGFSLQELFSDFGRLKGRQAEVYAKEDRDQAGNKVYTIYGSESYYMILLPNY